MKRFKLFVVIGLISLAQMSWGTSSAEAGPLLDWIRGLRNRSCLASRNTTPPALAGSPTCGLQPGQCQVTCQQNCSRTVVNYVPCTAYRTSWEKIPVTQYKPVTNSDPCTGCTVTCMKPCTSYTWQMKQVPYTTYRPVYRQETYKVPVTYITQDCGNGCNTCSTCPTTVPTMSSLPTDGCSTCNIGSTTSYVTPNGTIGSTESYSTLPSTGSMGTPTMANPADVPPSLDGVNPQSYQRIILDGARNSQPTNAAPVNYGRSALNNPVRNDWNYTPVRLASYEEPFAGARQISVNASRGFEGQLKSRSETPSKQTNSGWKSANW